MASETSDATATVMRMKRAFQRIISTSGSWGPPQPPCTTHASVAPPALKPAKGVSGWGGGNALRRPTRTGGGSGRLGDRLPERLGHVLEHERLLPAVGDLDLLG